MTLIFLGPKAQETVTGPPKYLLYNRYKHTASLPDQAKVSSYVATKISAEEKFSIATAFPDPWPPDLAPLWHFCQDKTSAAFTLAHVVIDHLVHDKVVWLCTKTNIQKRDFDSNFHWRKA